MFGKLFGKKKRQEEQIKKLVREEILDDEKNFAENFKKSDEYSNMKKRFIFDGNFNKADLQKGYITYFGRMNPNPLKEYQVDLNNVESINTFAMIYYFMDVYIVKEFYNSTTTPYDKFLAKHMIFFSEEYPNIDQVSTILIVLDVIIKMHSTLLKEIHDRDMSSSEKQQLMLDAHNYSCIECENYTKKYEETQKLFQ